MISGEINLQQAVEQLEGDWSFSLICCSGAEAVGEPPIPLNSWRLIDRFGSLPMYQVPTPGLDSIEMAKIRFRAREPKATVFVAGFRVDTEAVDRYVDRMREDRFDREDVLYLRLLMAEDGVELTPDEAAQILKAVACSI